MRRALAAAEAQHVGWQLCLAHQAIASLQQNTMPTEERHERPSTRDLARIRMVDC
jgi:hypothetical protein